MSRNELMERLELTHRTNFKENYLGKALERGWVEMTLPEKPTSRKQKYRITKLGKIQIEKLRNEKSNEE